MNHWATQYLGMPWVSGAVGPAQFDCWGFVRHVKRVHEGIELPVISVDATDPRLVLKAFRQHPELQRYEVHDKSPKAGDVVLMKHCKHPTHCGLWVDVDGGGVLHCAQGSGVVFQSLNSLKATGWAGVLFYRLKSEFLKA
jgi:cell wall-associated NlpC family hydrolase